MTGTKVEALRPDPAQFLFLSLMLNSAQKAEDYKDIGRLIQLAW
jgi:hypothetical protein